MNKRDLIRILEEISLLLQLKGENPFKARAYENAARALEGDCGELEEIVSTDRLRELPGIGEALEEKIRTLARSGRLAYHEDLRNSVPAGLLHILRIPGLGPKRVHEIWKNLGITTLGELEYACHENRLVDLPGFGEKSQSKILLGIERLKQHRDRFHCDVALREAETLLEGLRDHPAVIRIEVGGSVRRRCETSKDVDLVASTEDPRALMDEFVRQPRVIEIVARGETKSSVRLTSGMGADLRAVSDLQFPFALNYFTGSKEHNVALRSRASRRGLKLNEYGLFRGETPIPCRGEEEIYDHLGLAYVPPELREDRGELALAESGELPRLVTEGDLRGVLHVHTNASDGSASLEAMADAARKMGMTYLGVCDHSQAARYARGLDESRVEEQHREVDRLNQAGKGIAILKGIEVDILADGSLDFSDSVLARFDFVVASVHSYLHLSEAAMTERIVRALGNRHVRILGHPTGRLLLAREPYAMDMSAILRAAAARDVAIELNANPHRLDVDWRVIPSVRAAGLKVSINPDAHHPDGMGDMRYGVGIARKGALGREDVINALPLDDLLRFFRKGR